jgi:hypothetical protein
LRVIDAQQQSIHVHCDRKRKKMSFTSHLGSATSPVGQFLRQRFASTTGLTKEANKLLRSVTTLRPAASTCPYGTLGMAIDYRIRYSFAITPSNQLTAWQGAPILAFKPLESNEDVPVDWEDLPQGAGIPTRLDASGIPLGIAQGPYPWKLIASFFAKLDTFLAEIQPVKRRLEPEAERILARYCFVLSLFEEAFRSDRYRDGPLLVPAPKRSVRNCCPLLRMRGSLIYARWRPCSTTAIPICYHSLQYSIPPL